MKRTSTYEEITDRLDAEINTLNEKSKERFSYLAEDPPVSSDISVISWNLGTLGDFSSLIHCCDSGKKLMGLDNDELMSLRDKMFAVILPKLCEHAQILVLQETQEVYVEQYVSPHFHVVKTFDKKACVVYDTRNFNVKSAHFPRYHEEFNEAMTKSLTVVLKHRQKGASISVSSVHLTGCLEIHEETLESSTGKKELKSLISEVTNIGLPAIIGGDFNVTEGHPTRKLLSTNGFVSNPILLHTNFCYNAVRNDFPDPKRSIDTIASLRTTTGSKFALETKETSPELLDKMHMELGEPTTNPSDHIPIIRCFTLEEKEEKKGGLWDGLAFWH